MAKHVFGEYSAYSTPGGIRFMKNGRLASEASLPAEVVTFLKDKFGDDSGKVVKQEPKPEPKFPRPSEEELAKMRAESLQVKPELQMTPEQIQERTPIQDSLEPQLNESDFDTPTSVEQADTEPTAEQMHEVSEMLKDSNGNEPLPRAVEPAPGVSSDFLETVSIHTASLADMAQALYERFGIYTVYLRKLPEADEVNPLTGVAFTKYHHGIAYQAAIYAQNQGFLDRDPNMQRTQIDAARAASANFQVDKVAHTMAEARQANDFNFRTSVRGTDTTPTTRVEHVKGDDGEYHAIQVPIPVEEQGNLNGASQRYSQNEDEMIVEPPIMGGKPIIRPNW